MREIVIPEKSDWKKVNFLAYQVHKMHVNWRPDLFLDVEEVISKENFEFLIENKRIYVAKANNIIVGYITFSIKEKINPTMKYKKLLSVEAICVDEKHRGQGIGTLLLNFAKNVGKENNCTDIYLTVNEENTDAIKFYEKFGFKIKNISYLAEI